ncbi:hypothetical protein [Candidatus Villigracilis affinis]|uniref:hypothetical protein n=1 Tax=Candidatus Villigracilis affinis TaxID=3140682 RepID=UPI001D33BD70|nr:hypothetical protein [Anaerolineales bacterium]
MIRGLTNAGRICWGGFDHRAFGECSCRYISSRKRAAVVKSRSILVIAIVFVVFWSARVCSNRTLAPYGYPLQAAGLLITALFGLEAGLVISIPLCLLAAYGLPDTIGLAPICFPLLWVCLCWDRAPLLGLCVRALPSRLTGLVVLLAYRLPFLHLTF